MAAKNKVREAKKALYRELLLEAAERVFAANGYDDAKIDEIAREAGLSLGTVYGVFSGKAEIFQAIHEAHDADLFRMAYEEAPADAEPFERMLGGVRGYVGYFLEHPDFLRIRLQEGFTWGTEDAGAKSPERTESWKRGVELMSLAMQRCIDAGLVHEGDARLMARMMIAMQQVQLAHWIEGNMQEPPAAVAERVVDDVRRFFGTGRAASAATK